MVATNELRRAVATALGEMLIEFGRLDMNLGLAIAAQEGGARFDDMVNSIDQQFASRIQSLADAAKTRYGSEESGKRYEQWVDEANQLRLIRNRLVHCRWGFTPDGKAVSVIGMPTSRANDERAFTLHELETINRRLVRLDTELASLRKDFPV
jgi:hypothetical protein